ncbi:MAG: hypothetical protein M0R80_28130 [Proteobacteria bacterium]|jgi:hypothetical protein|nr:hypothetical protein [Pseudomonadota bacterium]
MMENVQKLVGLLRDRLEGKREDLAVISATGYSFEGWIKWEAFCEWSKPKAHPSLGTELPYPVDRKNPPRCDIVFVPPIGANSKGDGWVELAVVHDWTSGKWTSKIEDDIQTIRQAEVPGAVIVVCTAKKPVSLRQQTSWGKGWEKFFTDLRIAVGDIPGVPVGWPDPAVEGMQINVFALIP